MADSGDNFLKGFLFGGIVGGALGILFAPKSGRETREELGEETEKILARAKVDIENARKAAMQSFDESRDKIIEKMMQEKEEPAKKEADKRTKPVAEKKRPARKRTRRPRPKSE